MNVRCTQCAWFGLRYVRHNARGTSMQPNNRALSCCTILTGISQQKMQFAPMFGSTDACSVLYKVLLSSHNTRWTFSSWAKGCDIRHGGWSKIGLNRVAWRFPTIVRNRVSLLFTFEFVMHSYSKRGCCAWRHRSYMKEKVMTQRIVLSHNSI